MARKHKLPISRPLIKETALFFAQKENISSFKASEGCLTHFKEKRNLRFSNLHGESNDADVKEAEEFRKEYKGLVKDYKEDDIFNADETGIFYKIFFLHFSFDIKL